MYRPVYQWLLLVAVALGQGCGPANYGPVAVPASPAEVVEAHKFVLIGANGDPIAELGSSQGGGGLVLMDSTGKPRAALVLTGAGEPGLKLYDNHGIVQAALMVGNDGRSGLAIYDSKGRDRAGLATDADGAAVLMLFDGDGRIIGVVPATSRNRRHPTRSRSKRTKLEGAGSSGRAAGRFPVSLLAK